MSEQDDRPRKRRAATACDSCHRRKVKCDGASNPNGICSNCESSQIDCTYAMEKKKRGPKTGSKRRPPSEVASLIYTILAAPQSFPLPEDARTMRDMLIDLASYARTLEDKLNRAPSPNNARMNSQGSPASQLVSDTVPSDLPQTWHDNMDSLATRIHGFSLLPNGVPGLAQLPFLQTALEIRDELYGGNADAVALQKRSEFWNPSPWNDVEQIEPSLIFPEDDLLRDLVSVYFSRLHYLFPLFHRPTFERQVFDEKLHLRNRMFGAALLAVCANASRHSNDPRNLYNGSHSEHSLGWKYFNQIRFLRLTFLQPMTLFEVQLYAMSMLFLFPVTNGVGSWPWEMCRPCILLAQNVVSIIGQRSQKSHRDMVESELWTRAYWLLLVFEFIRGRVVDRPNAMTSAQLEFGFPKECDDEFWFTSDPELSFLQPPGKPSYMAYWIHTLKLIIAAGRTHTLVANNLEGAPKPLDQTRAHTNDWIASVPSHLRWDPHNPDSIFFHQSLILQNTYHRVQMQVHRPLLRPGPMNFSSLKICVRAARACLQNIEVQHQRPDCLMLPNLIHQVFICGVFLLINFWKRTWINSTPDQEQETAGVYRCLHFLTLYERRYETAGRLYDVLRTMVLASKIPPPSEPPSLKRTRSHDEPVDSHESYPNSDTQTHLASLSNQSLYNVHGTTNDNQSWERGPASHETMSSADVTSDALGEQPAILPYDSRNEEDWISFMAMVDDMLQAVRSDSLNLDSISYGLL